DGHAHVRIGGRPRMLPPIHGEDLCLVGHFSGVLDAVLGALGDDLLDLPAPKEPGDADEVVQRIQHEVQVHLLRDGLYLIHDCVPFRAASMANKKETRVGTPQLGQAPSNYFTSACCDCDFTADLLQGTSTQL